MLQISVIQLNVGRLLVNGQQELCRNSLIKYFLSIKLSFSILQGDQERNLDLPITHLCDKYTVNTAKSQTGFIDFVVAPFFGLLKGILPKIEISNIEINKNIWKDQIDHYENELSKIAFYSFHLFSSSQA